MIINTGENDSLQIRAGEIDSSVVSGDDVIIGIKGASDSATVTLTGAASFNFVQSGGFLVVDNINTIVNSSDKKKITGSSGKDFIINTGENVTIAPGKGNDTITGANEYGDLYQFAYTNGDNLITNFDRKDTLKSTSGTISTVVSGDDVIVSITKGTKKSLVTLQGAAEFNFIQDGNALFVDNGVSFTSIENSSNNARIAGTDYADLIINTGENGAGQRRRRFHCRQ